jgi:hypothetical protein
MGAILDFYNEHERLVIVVFGAVVGLIIGLLIGWVIWPTEFENSTPVMLRSDFKSNYLVWTAEEYNQTGDLQAAAQALGLDVEGRGAWDEGEASETLEALANDLRGEQATHVLALVTDLQGYQPLPEEEPGTRSTLAALFWILLVLLVVVMAAIGAYILYKRFFAGREETSERAVTSRHIEPVVWETEGTPPLTQFVTTYTLGDDFYDPSFSIEKENGDFLGECGVGISEDIGVGDPKKVTALEVWLFDKNDIRTVTKVIMSEHAFNDDALRASLASKGDLVLASEGTEVTLDTATLILRGRVLELEYGEGQLPHHSFFKRITLELGAWVKPGMEDATPDDFNEFSL